MSSDPDFKYKCVLLVDDSELDTFIHEKLIKGYRLAKQVYVSSSAYSALELLHNLGMAAEEFPGIYPSVIFVDINMPVMDGFEFINNFRKTVEKLITKPKLVVLTSSAAEKDRERTKLISKDILFLNKPLTRGMLEKLWSIS